MSNIRNKISTKELIEAILKITNNVILLYKKTLEKDICKHNTLTCALFGNTTMSKEKMESIRKTWCKSKTYFTYRMRYFVPVSEKSH